MDIEYLVMDVDGTLTDGKIYMGKDGEVMKAFSIKDGYGIHDLLIPSGVEPVIITGRKSIILENRCRELGITSLYQGVSDKTAKLKEIVDEKKWNSVAYIGDDLNDLPCMTAVKKQGGKVGCPKNAAHQIYEVADFISNQDGGDGAVRDFIEWLLQS